jgi:tetratricopeptide (TPR) repeat protein
LFVVQISVVQAESRLRQVMQTDLRGRLSQQLLEHTQQQAALEQEVRSRRSLVGQKVKELLVEEFASWAEVQQNEQARAKRLRETRRRWMKRAVLALILVSLASAVVGGGAWVASGRAEAEKAAVARREETYKAAMAKGETALAARQFAPAITAFDEALKAKPGDPTAAEGKAAAEFHAAMEQAKAAEDAGRWDSALEAYDRAVAVKPGDPAARAGRERAKTENTYHDAMSNASSASSRHDWEAAARSYERALEVKPGDPAATEGRSAARLMQWASGKHSARATEKQPKNQTGTDSGSTFFWGGCGWCCFIVIVLLVLMAIGSAAKR